MGWFDNLFGGGKEKAYRDMQNSIQQGMDAYNGAYNQGRSDLEPWRQSGWNEYQKWMQENDRMSDPNAFNAWLAKGYAESPQYKNELAGGVQAITAGDAASGMYGTPDEQERLTRFGQKIAGDDMDRYLNRQGSIWGQYMGNLGQFSGMGYGAAGNEANMANQYGQNMAEMWDRYGQAKAGEDEAHANKWNNFIGDVGGILGGWGNSGNDGANSKNPNKWKKYASDAAMIAGFF